MTESKSSQSLERPSWWPEYVEAVTENKLHLYECRGAEECRMLGYCPEWVGAVSHVPSLHEYPNNWEFRKAPEMTEEQKQTDEILTESIANHVLRQEAELFKAAMNKEFGQTKLESFVETIINTAIGYGVALLSQIAIFPLFGIHVPLSTNLWIGAWFTAISIVRGYVVRRWFNARIKQAARAFHNAR